MCVFSLLCVFFVYKRERVKYMYNILAHIIVTNIRIIQQSLIRLYVRCQNSNTYARITESPARLFTLVKDALRGTWARLDGLA